MGALSFGDLPFAEQIDYFRGKINLPTRTWRDIERGAHERAFVVAGAMKADLLNDLREAVDAGIADGETLQQFRARFDDTVARNGWSYVGERNWRTRVIYQTNMATSYAAGRLQQLEAAAGDGLMWMYKHSGADHPRLDHLSWDGLTLPADDPWWETHYPPNGWGCGCYVIAVHPDRVARMGGRIEAAPDEDGAGIGEGWDYQPGAAMDAELREFIDDKAASLPAELAQAMLDEIAVELLRGRA